MRGATDHPTAKKRSAQRTACNSRVSGRAIDSRVLPAIFRAKKPNAIWSADCEFRMAPILKRQQPRFDEFRHRYDVRPRQGLGQRRPQELYYHSSRIYELVIEPWQYPDGIVVT